HRVGVGIDVIVNFLTKQLMKVRRTAGLDRLHQLVVAGAVEAEDQYVGTGLNRAQMLLDLFLTTAEQQPGCGSAGGESENRGSSRGQRKANEDECDSIGLHRLFLA